MVRELAFPDKNDAEWFWHYLCRRVQGHTKAFQMG